MSTSSRKAIAHPGQAARRVLRVGMTGLLTANVVSVAGGALSVVALPWFVLATTGSTVATGLTALCETLPVVAVSLIAGVIVDRVGARTTRIASDVVSAVTVLAVPVLHATVGIAFWQLLALVAINGAVRAPAPAASLVLLNTLSGSTEGSGDRARAAYSAGIRLASVLSVPIGGLLIGWQGAPAALIADAATFAVSAVIVAITLRPPPAPRVHAPSAPTASRPWTGLTVLAGDRLLRTMTALVIVLAMLSGAWNSVLAPAYGQQVLHDPTLLGVLLGAFSAGALAGNLAFPWIGIRIDHHLLLWTCLATATVLGYGAPALTPSVLLLAPVLLLAGIATGLLGPLWLGLLTTRTKPNQNGHVFGVTFALEQAGAATGALIAGLLAAHLGITATLTTTAASGSALALLAATAPPLSALHSGRR